MRARFLHFLILLIAGCGAPPPNLTNGRSTDGGPALPSPTTDWNGKPTDRYGPNAPERNPNFAQGSDRIVGNWQLRNVFTEANGEFHDTPASGSLELRPDGTCVGTQANGLANVFDGSYTIKRGWLEFSAFGTVHFDYLVNTESDAGQPAYVLKLNNGQGIKLTYVRPIR